MKTAALLVAGALWAAGADDRGVKVDNELVRVLKVVDTPRRKGAMHSHAENRVMIYLDAGEIKLTYEDGKVDHQKWTPDQVAWSPAGGRHTSENVGSTPIGIVEIELRQAAPAAPPVRDAALDPVAADPAHNVLLFDNPQVRVFRSWREPGATEPMHEHTGRGRIAVLLSELDGTVTTSDGRTSPMTGARGDVFWSAGPVTHAGTNKGVRKFDMILVEVK